MQSIGFRSYAILFMNWQHMNKLIWILNFNCELALEKIELIGLNRYKGKQFGIRYSRPIGFIYAVHMFQLYVLHYNFNLSFSF